MKKQFKYKDSDDALPEYDFGSMRAGVRGKYYERYKQGTNVVLLAPDVAEAFRTEAAVNQALRGILKTKRAVRHAGSSPGTPLSAGQSRKSRSRN